MVCEEHLRDQSGLKPLLVCPWNAALSEEHLRDQSGLKLFDRHRKQLPCVGEEHLRDQSGLKLFDGDTDQLFDP